jgi:stress-induced morphogen
MATTRKKEELRKRVEEALRAAYPDIKFHWYDRARYNRIGGTVTSSAFEDMVQIDRQLQVSKTLREALGEDSKELGLIGALTEEERTFIQSNP